MQIRRRKRSAHLPKYRLAILLLFSLLLAGGLVLLGGPIDRDIVMAQIPLQTYDLSWWTVDGGGGSSTGTGYALEGTAGQPDPGPTLSGGSYLLEGGFWGGGLSGVSWHHIHLPLVLRHY
jgi:hypothetical protein